MKTATAIDGAVPVARHDRLGDGVEALIVDNPTNDYAGFAGAPGAVRFGGRVFGRSSYDTDRGHIVYRTDRAVAVAAESEVRR